MGTTIVRYRTMPEHADENQQLVEAVYEELATTAPDRLRYRTFRLADSTFSHIADIDGEGNPLNDVAAFAAFVRGVAERREPGQGPNPQAATLVGSFRYPCGAGEG